MSGGPQTSTKERHMALPNHSLSTSPKHVATPRSLRQVEHTIARMHDNITFPILEILTQMRTQKARESSFDFFC